MYKEGVVYIWQNQVGVMACLNGVETMIDCGPNPPCKYVDKVWWGTQTSDPTFPGSLVIAVAGDLREKYPPSGERSILELFKQPQLEPA